MTRITVSLPDDLAERTRTAGLLSDEAIRQLLEDAMRREAGRRLLEIADRLRASKIPPMSEDEIVAEVHAVRAELRGHNR